MSLQHIVEAGYLLNEIEAARILGLSVKTLRRWRFSGRGVRYIKLGAAVRYDPQDLAAFVAAGRRTSTSDQGVEAEAS
jgi:hypothetical protein